MTQPERFDALTAALARTTARHTETSSIDPDRATETDLLVALTAIADELRTANLLAAASLRSDKDTHDQGNATGDEALRRLGYTPPDREYDPMKSFL